MRKTSRMRMRSLPVALLALALAGTGCPSRDPSSNGPSAEKREAVPPAGSEQFRGHAVFGHEVRSLRPCGSEQALWAVDESGLLWKLHEELAPHREPYEELFVVVRGRSAPAPDDGFGAGYAGGIAVDEVLYVAREGFGCETGWAGFGYRAQGNEPSWVVVVSNGEMRLNRLGAPPTTWNGIREQRTGGSLSFSGVGEDGAPVELAIERLPCRDTMSGSYHSLTATLRLGEERLSGCAVQGDAAATR